MAEETLLIVGNGFDLSMGFKTSYGDFMKSSYFPNKETSPLCSYLHDQYEENMGWIDIENELSKYSQLLSRFELTPETGKIDLRAESFREEYEELKSSLKNIFKKKPKVHLVLVKITQQRELLINCQLIVRLYLLIIRV